MLTSKLWIMLWDVETSAMQLHALLKSKGINISRHTILRCRSLLGWTFCGSAYCQMIRQANMGLLFNILSMAPELRIAPILYHTGESNSNW